jgi:uncharacterized protein (TIGR03086 family)
VSSSPSTREPSLDVLSRALDQTGALISGVGADQARLPTPCANWNLQQLINHTVYDLRLFARLLRGEPREAPDADLIGDNWSAAYRAAADGLLDTWRARGTEGTITSSMGELPTSWAIGQHIADTAVHGWDVARATHQSTDLDAEVAEVALAWAKQNLKPQLRGQAFGPEVPVSESAPIYHRLAAYFGRDPS